MANKLILLLVTALSFALTGCDDSPTPSPDTTPPPPVTQPPSKAEETRDAVSASYAGVAQLSLRLLELPEDLAASQVSVVTGTAPGLTVKDGYIRFLTGPDTGSESDVVLKVSLANKDVKIPVNVPSERPTAIVGTVEADENGNPSPEPPAIVIKGLSAGNALLGGELSFRIEGAPPLREAWSNAGAVSLAENATFDLTKYWAYDTSANAFVISAQAMQTLLAALPSGELQVSVSLASADGKSAHSYTFNAFKPDAKVTGRVIDTAGQVLTALAGRQVALVGQGNPARLVADIRADGTFEAAGLTAGTYQVALLDVSAPNAWVAVMPIYVGSKAVSIDLVAGKATTTAAKAMSASGSGVNQVRQSTVKQDGTPPPSREQSAAPASRLQAMSGSGLDCTPIQAGNGGSTVSVSGTGRGTSNSCPLDIAIPKGTAKVEFRAEVSTAEFPTFTQSKSQYNDSWSYSISGLPDITGAAGTVNQTHHDMGAVVKQKCVDVSALTKESGISVTGSLVAANVGDGLLPTTVKVTVTPSCSDKLRVTSANMSLKNAKGYQVIVQKKNAGEGAYISLPTKQAQPEWGVPLTVQYEPATAELTKARVGIFYGGTVTFADADVLPQAKKAAGTLTFNDLVLPPLPFVQKFAGKTSIVVELTGVVNGASVTSDAKVDSPVTVNGAATTFTALFRAADYITASTRRYGGKPDSGGDDWSTSETIDWLNTVAYRFNDVSALHIAQNASNGKSVLVHQGHNNGRQIDMRYADGSGGYSENLGGANDGTHIKAMLDAAAAEVASKAQPHPKLDIAVNWVKANRLMLEREAANAEKQFIGPSFIGFALVDGVFPDGKTAIPGVSSNWPLKQYKVYLDSSHMHHWHLSRAVSALPTSH